MTFILIYIVCLQKVIFIKIWSLLLFIKSILRSFFLPLNPYFEVRHLRREGETMKIRFALSAMILLIVCFASTRIALATVFPGEHWSEAGPESQGVDSAQMNAAIAYLGDALAEHGGVSEMVIVKNGLVIHAGDASFEFRNCYSITKSYVSALFGILQAEGKCSLETPAAQIDPVLAEKYPDLRLKHFLQMESGYDAVNPEGLTRWGDRNNDWSATPFDPNDPMFAPGTAFEYHNEAMLMFGRLLTIIAEQDLLDLLNERILNVIGREAPFRWANNRACEKDVDGIPVRMGASDIWTSARDLARFGLLYLNNGNWDGIQLIDPEWVAQVQDSQAPHNREYGYNWYVNDQHVRYSDAPENLYLAWGIHNNVIFVIPEWDMVITRTGNSQYVSGIDEIWNDFFRLMQSAILPPQPEENYFDSIDFIDPMTDETIGVVEDGDRLALSELVNGKLAIAAVSANSAVKSVQFDLDGAMHFQSTESMAPFALFGDCDGDYYDLWTPVPGMYTLSAKAFGEPLGQGDVLEELTVQFEITEP